MGKPGSLRRGERLGEGETRVVGILVVTAGVEAAAVEPPLSI